MIIEYYISYFYQLDMDFRFLKHLIFFWMTMLREIFSLNIACYRIGVRGKKWYWPLITWMFDVALQNSWILYNKTGNKKISQLIFRREVVNVYLQRYKIMPKGIGRPSTSSFSDSHCRISDSWNASLSNSHGRQHSWNSVQIYKGTVDDNGGRAATQNDNAHDFTPHRPEQSKVQVCSHRFLLLVHQL